MKKGATIVVTEHGRRVARLVPEGDTRHERLGTLENTGTVLWSGRRLGRAKPGVRPRGTRTVAEIIVENRG